MCKFQKIKSQERRDAIQAINHLGGFVTIWDVAHASGLPIRKAWQWLNTIAAETGARIVVTEAGDLAYAFPSGLEENPTKRSRVHLAKEAMFNFGKHILAYAARSYVGVMLILSPFCLSIFWTLFVFTAMGMFRRRTDEMFSKQTLHAAITLVAPFLELFKWNFDLRGDSFSADCLTFILGGGDPNHRLEAKKWKTIGELIRANDGVVVQEQLAPYVDGLTPYDESAVIPILVHFEGRPYVTRNGHIIYLFPQMQTSAREKRQRHKLRLVPSLLEKTWHLGSLPSERLTLVLGFAGLNLLGYIGLCEHTFFTWSNPFFLFFWNYLAFAFLLIGVPSIRAVVLAKRNQEINRRNNRRVEAALRLHESESDKALSSKLSEARRFARRWSNVLNQKTIFCTHTDQSHQYQRSKELHRMPGTLVKINFSRKAA